MNGRKNILNKYFHKNDDTDNDEDDMDNDMNNDDMYDDDMDGDDKDDGDMDNKIDDMDNDVIVKQPDTEKQVKLHNYLQLAALRRRQRHQHAPVLWISHPTYTTTT